jgi:predicted DNA-binding transcriptional regulator AlpA
MESADLDYVLTQRSSQSKLDEECLITTKQLRRLFGDCSEMHIWRLLNEKKYQALTFPKPIKINDRNYWRLASIRQWICEREVQAHAASRASSRSALSSRLIAPPCNSDLPKQKCEPPEDSR